MHSYPNLMQAKKLAGGIRVARARDGACELRTEGRKGRSVNASHGARVMAEWQGSHYS